MKAVIIFAIGFAAGAFVVKYHDDTQFRESTNAHVDSVMGRDAGSDK